MVGLGRMGILLNRGSSSSSSQTGTVPYGGASSASGGNNSSSNGSNGFVSKDRGAPPSQPFRSPHHLTAETVAALPPPGQTSPSSFAFSPGSRYLSFFSSSHGNAIPLLRSNRNIFSSSTSTTSSLNSPKVRSGSVNGSLGSSHSLGERKLCGIDMLPYLLKSNPSGPSTVQKSHHEKYSAQKNNITTKSALAKKQQIFSHDQVFSLLDSSSLETAENNGDSQLSLEERLRRERQRLHATGVTQFSWSTFRPSSSSSENLELSAMEVNNDNSASLGELMCTSMKGTTEVVLKKKNTHRDSKNRNGMKTSEKHHQYDRSSNSQENSCTGNISRLQSLKLTEDDHLRILIPLRGNIYVQDGIGAPLRLVYDKNYSLNLMYDEMNKNHNGTNYVDGTSPRKSARNNGSTVGRDDGAIDPQLSPDGNMVAFVVAGEIYTVDACNSQQQQNNIQKTLNVPIPVRLTFGANQSAEDQNSEDNQKESYITHGLADFVAQEEMDRYRGFWWNPTSDGIVFARVDESHVPPYRISHQGRDGTGSSTFEDHRYPFAGERNPKVTLGFIHVCKEIIGKGDVTLARTRWEVGKYLKWLEAPPKATEYLARVCFLPDGSICAQWENRAQTCLLLLRIDAKTWESSILLKETSKIWINLHHMFRILPRAITPYDTTSNNRENKNPPEGSFSFLFASERTGYCHLYLYTYIGGSRKEAVLVRAVSAGKWIVESIAGVNMEKNEVYVTGTFDSPLERHLYSLPLTINPSDSSKNKDAGDSDSISSLNSVGSGRLRIKAVINSLTGNMDTTSSSATILPPDPKRLTIESGMHSVVMDRFCQFLVDTNSDLKRPTSVKVYGVKSNTLKLLFVLHDNSKMIGSNVSGPYNNYAPPELIQFKTSDQSEVLYAALYLPDPKVHGPGPYPLVASVYGGPHVQRVNRSWSQSTDMRAQRLRSLGFAIVKCDNRGSSRRGHNFEAGIHRRLGRLEVLDQVTAVRHLIQRGVADPNRVGIYGWSYGGYLAAMCLFRAPDVFHAAVAGAPVTSWDGYDTHYTERYMGTPQNNPDGYRESAVLEHVGNMRGQLMIVHGLIDENVHFRHSARLINRLISAGKAYDLLLFPDERHSPRRLRDRVYMEQRINDYFVKNLGVHKDRRSSSIGNVGDSNNRIRPMGHL